MPVQKLISTFTAISLFLALNLLPADRVQAQTPEEMTVFLPLVAVDGPAQPRAYPLHSGEATYYDADGSGSCRFGPSPDDLLVAAMNAAQWDSAAYCGAFLRVRGPLGEVTVRVVDQCPGCPADDLDLSREAFAQIASLSAGRVPVTWKVVSGEVEGPVQYAFSPSSSQWWLAVQVRNHRNPLAKLEYLRGEEWVKVERKPWNDFVIDSPDPGPGPFSFRLTDGWGNVLVDEGVPLEPGETVSGAGQFPAVP